MNKLNKLNKLRIHSVQNIVHNTKGQTSILTYSAYMNNNNFPILLDVDDSIEDLIRMPLNDFLYENFENDLWEDFRKLSFLNP